MGKKESVPKDSDIQGKLNIGAAEGGEGRTARGVPFRLASGAFKLIAGVCLLPFVYSFSASFLNEFAAVDEVFRNYFWAGAISFLIIYLFVYEPAVVYNKGQKLLGLVFQFFKPLVKVAPYVLPIYTIAAFVVYLIFSFALKSSEALGYFVFLMSFSMALHLVFGARSVRSKQGDFLKANYIFGFSFVYIIDMALLAFCLNVMFKEFSFVNFINNSFQDGKGIIYSVFKQLFL